MKIKKSPVQVSHLLLPITKRLHYFYANRAFYQCRKKRLNFKCFQISRPYFIGRGQLGFCYAYNYAVHAVYLKDIFAVYLENVYAVHLEDEFAARHPFD